MSRLLLAAVPAAAFIVLAVISFLRYLFDESVHTFNFNVSYNCCSKTKKRKKILLARVFLFRSIVDFRVCLFFVSFLC